MVQYVYQPLDETNDEIRLITLLPAADRDSEVICDLSIVRLTDEDVPQYEALSYTWGSAESPCRLRVSSSSDHNINITENLAEALPYLRDPVSPRVLWIDSIAINQKDLSERGQQVQRMADIFSLAERVIVWLGLDDADSKTVMEICEFLDAKVFVNFDSAQLTQCDDTHWGDRREQLPYDIQTWQAILNFLRRPWFHRLWIWQEICLAKPNAIIMCGTDAMRWRYLQTLLGCIVYKRSRTPSEIWETEEAPTLVMNGFYLASFDNSKLVVLLETMRLSRCTDPRDRVYGALGLLSKTEMRIELRPDYEKPVIDVYMDLMMHFTQKTKFLDLLSLCRYNETMGNWPSWTPDLTNLKAGNVIRSHASGASGCEVVLLQNRVLRVTGIKLGQINTVNKFDPPYRDCNSHIQQLAKDLDMASDYVDGRPMAEAFCLSICGGAISDLHIPPTKAFPRLESTLRFLQDIMRLGDNEISMYQGEATVFNHISSACSRGAFFRTCSNHFGLGALGAREGDHICVLLGCNSPMIIRADSHGRYKIIGESYVCGLGSNEAFLGSLPSAFKEVFHYNGWSRQWHRVFLHTESGKIHINDPRLDTELPLGWRSKTDERGEFWQEFSHESARDTWTVHDPRLTKSELLKRGVPLEDIEFS